MWKRRSLSTVPFLSCAQFVGFTDCGGWDGESWRDSSNHFATSGQRFSSSSLVRRSFCSRRAELTFLAHDELPLLVEVLACFPRQSQLHVPLLKLRVVFVELVHFNVEEEVLVHRPVLFLRPVRWFHRLWRLGW